MDRRLSDRWDRLSSAWRLRAAVDRLRYMLSLLAGLAGGLLAVDQAWRLAGAAWKPSASGARLRDVLGSLAWLAVAEEALTRVRALLSLSAVLGFNPPS